MAEIINLRQARKQKARAERAEQAAVNRVQFGRSKAERTLTAARTALQERRLDATRRDAPAKPAEDGGAGEGEQQNR